MLRSGGFNLIDDHWLLQLYDSSEANELTIAISSTFQIVDLKCDIFTFSGCDPQKFVSLEENDVVIASYPQSGGNLVSEILYNIVVSCTAKLSIIHNVAELVN